LSREKRFKGQHWDDAFVRGLKKQFLEIRGRIGVCCMTDRKENILMWSHYAGQHTGFCLEFQTDDPFFQRVRHVNYPPSGKVPCVNVLTPEWNKTIASGTEALLTKAEGWAYEHEWRIIDLENGAGPRQFPPEALHGVILGCRVHDEDKKQALEWCKGRTPRPILYQAHEKKAEYGLDIEAIPY
jgi:hypothetical protein